MKNSLLTLMLLHFVILSFCQSTGYGIKEYDRPIKKELTSEVKEICDINPNFPATWVKEYISVEVSVMCDGEILKAEGVNENFTEEQKRIIKMGETGTDIVVVVKYYPDNNLAQEAKEIDFAYTIVPDIDAVYESGEEVMQQYFKENAVDRIFEATDKDVHKIIVSFDISESGDVINPLVSQRSHSSDVDEIVLSAVKNMSKWIPARNADGTIVDQSREFIITREMCSNRTLYVYE
jgi:TonB family protein